MQGNHFPNIGKDGAYTALSLAMEGQRPADAIRNAVQMVSNANTGKEKQSKERTGG